LKKQLERLSEEWRIFKADADTRFENQAKVLTQSQTAAQESSQNLCLEKERLKEELERIKMENQTAKIEHHELEVKLEGYRQDYERYFSENKRLREHVNTVRDEKDTALSELNRLKSIYHERVNELTDECNLKIARLENQLLEQKEKHRGAEESAYEVMVRQEKMVEKWKGEHRETCSYFEKQVK
jgi:chromosome segregation ATPase